MKRIVQIATVLTLAWGALAFGSTYLWASRPLMLGCLVSGALAWLLARGAEIDGRAPLLAMAAVFVAIGLQLIPLPPAVIAAISPTALDVVTKLDLIYATERGLHPLSILPSATWHALALFVSFSVLLIGLTKFFSATGTRWMIWSLTAMGVVLALAGIVQKALGDGKLIYGFWTPQMPGSPFGPFVNRNHFAGWMLMALPLTIALLCAGIARGLRHVKPTVRDRVLWFGSREASELILVGAAAVVMGLALVMTMSRSGITAFALAIAVTGAFVLRGMRARAGKSVAGVYLLGLFILVVAWVGVDTVVTRFTETDWREFNNRLGAWTDARDIASRFPVTGTGLNTYGTATMFFQQHYMDEHFAQAHNDYLQLWAEGGLLLTIPAAVLVFAMATGIRRRFREDERQSAAWWARAGAVTGLVSIALQEIVEFSLQMPGNTALFAVLCAIALHKAPDRRRPSVVGPVAVPRARA